MPAQQNLSQQIPNSNVLPQQNDINPNFGPYWPEAQIIYDNPNFNSFAPSIPDNANIDTLVPPIGAFYNENSNLSDQGVGTQKLLELPTRLLTRLIRVEQSSFELK